VSDHPCCESKSGGSGFQPPIQRASPAEKRRPSIVRRCLKIIGWIVPSTILVLLPKCPACVAAYVAIGTGVGLSFSTASYLRMALMFLCIAALSYLAVKFLLTSAIFARWIRTSRFTRDG
jgi:hypothetical protein